METHFQVESACLEVSARNELLWRSMKFESSFRKSSTLFSSRGTKVLGVRYNKKIPFTVANEAKRPQNTSSLKDAKDLSEAQSGANEKIDG